MGRLTASPATLPTGGSTTLDAGGSTDDKGIADYAFSCGNGTAPVVLTRTTVRCTYAAAGTYRPSVVVRDAANHAATATTAVTVGQALPPTARLSLSDRTPAPGQRVIADASRSTGTSVSTVRAYRFKCGHQARTDWSKKSATRCTFRHTGWFTVKVWVKSSLGLKDVAIKRVHVTRRQ